ncbi:MlaD family protein [Nitratifractor sp.]|uniref:MlaD family protein n=1 Tax=Nitratifractor sp. TaxID=2268144 RepID=UPI0025FC80A6|nr:MlaD family protein [Nitratifractor sp.]
MYSKINYTMVGVFVLLFTLLALAFGFWLAKYGFEEKYDYYYLYYNEPVDGLTLDSSVKLKGVDVGKVTAIEIDPNNIERIRVTIRLKEGTPIVKGMYALLKLQGITGLSYVQIEGGKRGAPRLKASAGKIPVIPTRESLIHQLSQKAPELLEKLQSASDALEKIFSEHNQRQITHILDNTAAATAKATQVEDRLLALGDDFNRTLRHFDRKAAELTDSVQGVTRTLNEKLPKLLDNVDQAGQNVAQLARGIDRRLKRGDYDLRKMIRPIQIDIHELSYSYQELSEDLKALSRHPSSILFGAGHPPKGPGE